jgi:uncharacterized membrane protein
MKINPNLLRVGWLLVGILLANSGVLHIIEPRLFTRVVMDDGAVLEGAPVMLIGLAELAVGAVLIRRFFRSG